MTKIKSELLLASKNKANGVILFTWRLTYPHIVLTHVLTHRVFSRNTSSTRAIPTLKLIKAVWHDMFVPDRIGSAQKGMQAGPEITGFRKTLAVTAWKLTGFAACLGAYILYRLGVAKELAGRVVEPWSWVTQILSTTETENFFDLRIDEVAQPQIQELAALMEAQVEHAKKLLSHMEYRNNKHSRITFSQEEHTGLQLLEPGQWHLPLLKHHEQWNPVEGNKKISAARCARTSYTLLETGKVSTPHDDLILCDRLSSEGHYSPFEHQAMAMESDEFVGNFRGWYQFRKELESNG